MPSTKPPKNQREKSTRELSVIVPLHNEAATIASLLKRVVAQPDVGQLIVVDDASTDSSLTAVRQFAKSVPNTIKVDVIALKPNQGKGAAVNRGFTEVTQPYVIIQDADLEYDPADYHKLLAPLRAGETSVVFGSRFMRSATDTSNHVTLHDAGNKFLSGITSYLFDVQLTDMNTCYKCFDSRLIAKLNCTERRFAWDPQLTAQLISLGENIIEIPIWYQPRTIAEGKKIRWQDGFSQVRVLATERLKHWPVYRNLIVTLVAGALICGGLALQKITTIERIENQPMSFASSVRWQSNTQISTGTSCHTGSGFVIAGPYITLLPGSYQYRATAQGDGSIDGFVDTYSGPLNTIFATQPISGTNKIDITFNLSLPSWSYFTEFRVFNNQETSLCISNQSLTRTSLNPWATLITGASPLHSSKLNLPAPF